MSSTSCVMVFFAMRAPRQSIRLLGSLGIRGNAPGQAGSASTRSGRLFRTLFTSRDTS